MGPGLGSFRRYEVPRGLAGPRPSTGPALVRSYRAAIASSRGGLQIPDPRGSPACRKADRTRCGTDPADPGRCDGSPTSRKFEIGFVPTSRTDFARPARFGFVSSRGIWVRSDGQRPEGKLGSFRPGAPVSSRERDGVGGTSRRDDRGGSRQVSTSGRAGSTNWSIRVGGRSCRAGRSARPTDGDRWGRRSCRPDENTQPHEPIDLGSGRRVGWEDPALILSLFAGLTNRVFPGSRPDRPDRGERITPEVAPGPHSPGAWASRRRRR